MSDIETPVLVAARALNFVRREHPATYCALRMLVDSIPRDVIGPWLRAYVQRRPATLRYQTQRRYSVYKGVSESGLEYRQCLIPSPVSLLTEVWALALMARVAQFHPHKSVYSYLWASKDSPHIFEHFFDGYLRRELDVARACEALGPNAAVIISDIKGFYRSVRMDRLQPIVHARIADAGFSNDERTIVEFAVEAYFTKWNIKHGIPIGPPLGHVLGQLYLSEIDHDLYTAFPAQYFRYVDDIIVVCESDRVDATRAAIHEAIKRQGLDPNPDKDEVVSHDEWLAHAIAIGSQPNQDQFAHVRKEVRVWTDRVRETASLESALRQAGTSLPIVPLRTKPDGVTEWLADTFYKQVSKIVIPRLVAQISGVRDSLWNRLRDLENTSVQPTGSSRKWHIQSIRFTVNRLMQLVSRDGQSELARRIPDLDELRPLRAAVLALSDGDATHVLPFPGPMTSAVARLWVATQTSPMHLDVSSAKDEHSRQAVYDLWLFGAVTPDRAWINNIEDSRERALAMFSADLRLPGRSSHTFNYDDEIQALQMTAPEACHMKLKSRNTALEDVDDVFEPFY